MHSHAFPKTCIRTTLPLHDLYRHAARLRLKRSRATRQPMPRVHGSIVSWKEKYGFVHCPPLDKPGQPPSTIFLHEDDLAATRRPRPGDMVEFEWALDPVSGKPRAYSAKTQTRGHADRQPPTEFEGWPIQALIRTSKAVLKVLRHDVDGNWLSISEIRPWIQPNMRDMIEAALKFDNQQPAHKQHFTSQPREEREYQVRRTTSKRPRSPSPEVAKDSDHLAIMDEDQT